MRLLRRVLKENGTQVGTALVAKVIKAAGYKWRNAKVVLTSNDPTYKEKLGRNRQTRLSFRLMNTALLQSKPNPDARYLRRAFSRLFLSGKNHEAA